jgi:hypothetical protein
LLGLLILLVHITVIPQGLHSSLMIMVVLH